MWLVALILLQLVVGRKYVTLESYPIPHIHLSILTSNYLEVQYSTDSLKNVTCSSRFKHQSNGYIFFNSSINNCFVNDSVVSIPFDSISFIVTHCATNESECFRNFDLVHVEYQNSTLYPYNSGWISEIYFDKSYCFNSHDCFTHYQCIGNTTKECKTCPFSNTTSECSGHGNCIQNNSSLSCNCFTGYAGVGCQTCQFGYFGDDCDQCPGLINGSIPCNGHGMCVGSGTHSGNGSCICHNNFIGESCDECNKISYGHNCDFCGGIIEDIWPCYHHGRCDSGISGTGECQCELGFDNYTYCSTCLQGYFSPSCLKCPGHIAPCYGHGICDDGIDGTGSCTCNNGYNHSANCEFCYPSYHGEDCLPCPGIVNITHACNLNGLCKDGTCICSKGFDGDSCDRCIDNHFGKNCINCPEYNGIVCGGRGYCSGSGNLDGGGYCVCFPNYSGKFCEECSVGHFGEKCAPCPGLTPCNSHGHCDGSGLSNGSGLCRCDEWWTGDDCGTPVTNSVLYYIYIVPTILVYLSLFLLSYYYNYVIPFLKHKFYLCYNRAFSGKFERNFFENKEWIIDSHSITKGNVIGVGTSGRVYNGNYHGFNVALKTLSGNMVINHTLEDEVIILINLRHNNIVRFYGYSFINDEIYIVMELCHTSLLRLIEDENFSLHNNDYLKIARQICDGCCYLHSKNIIHRDLKPANILLTEYGDIKICDFGISKEMGLTNMNYYTNMIGTPIYMAPEIIKDENYSELVDVYSYGIILWEMYTRDIPYDGYGPFQVAHAVCNNIRPEIPKGIPENLRKLIVMCWSGDPYQRKSFAQILTQIDTHLFN